MNKSQSIRSAKIVQEQFLPPRRPGPREAKVVHPGSWELLMGGLGEEKRGPLYKAWSGDGAGPGQWEPDVRNVTEREKLGTSITN